MIAFVLSAALVTAVAGAYAHSHALGARKGEEDLSAMLLAEARRSSRGGA